MVVGLDIFKEHFKEFQNAYVIIGGTACDILIDEAGFTPRATKDIDVILLIEGLTPEFILKFWEFIILGEYKIREHDTVNKNSYRFHKPKNKDFPQQIELFSKKPDAFKLIDTGHLTPLPADEGLSNLSAILLNEEYYKYTITHSAIRDNVHFANEEALICLKAYAFLDNKKRKEKGQDIRSINIAKHKYDIFRMVFLMPADSKFKLPTGIKNNLQEFIDEAKDNLPDAAIFKSNGFGKQDMGDILNQLIKIFGLK